jgi:hypothetical protein
MEIPSFSGDEDKDEINPEKWLRMVKEDILGPCRESFCFSREDSKWWNNLYV